MAESRTVLWRRCPTGEFIDSPAYQGAAKMIVDDKAELKPGQTIGDYEIISFISRGRVDY